MAVAGELRVLTAVASLIFALLMGVLSVRFKSKLLLMIGLLLLTVSPLIAGFASSFRMMMASYSVFGVALAMVSPMTVALAGEHVPGEKLATAIGWIVAGLSISFIIGGPMIGFIAGLEGWRLAFLWYVLPISLLGLSMAAVGVPTISLSPQSTIATRAPYLNGFKTVFSNKSARASLFATALSMAAMQFPLLYNPSFFRQRFLLSTSLVSCLLMGSALSNTLGGLSNGGLTKRVGALKPLTTITSLLGGILIIIYTNLPNLWLSVTLALLASLIAGTRLAASESLALEQVPRYRGTMMSINTAAYNVGSAAGAAAGGLALLLFGYEGAGICLGAMSIGAAIIYHFLVMEPHKN